ncbi:hypothetical protein PFNF135_01514 [Plasmodium falciparum NF135/5.C10]|nr:hypothetical protein PFNF135_01514 [Plasmodium falciparum NF135/5.C10]
MNELGTHIVHKKIKRTKKKKNRGEFSYIFFKKEIAKLYEKEKIILMNNQFDDNNNNNNNNNVPTENINISNKGSKSHLVKVVKKVEQNFLPKFINYNKDKIKLCKNFKEVTNNTYDDKMGFKDKQNVEHTILNIPRKSTLLSEDNKNDDKKKQHKREQKKKQKNKKTKKNNILSSNLSASLSCNDHDDILKKNWKEEDEKHKLVIELLKIIVTKKK